MPPPKWLESTACVVPVRLPSIEFWLDQSLWLWVSSIAAQPSQPCWSIVEVVGGVAQPVTRTTTSFKMRCSSSPMCAGLHVELLLQMALLRIEIVLFVIYLKTLVRECKFHVYMLVLIGLYDCKYCFL